MNYRFVITNNEVKIFKNDREITIDQFLDELTSMSKNESPEVQELQKALDGLFNQFSADLEREFQNLTDDTDQIVKSWDGLVQGTANISRDIGNMFNRVMEVGNSIGEIAKVADKSDSSKESTETNLTDITAKANEILAKNSNLSTDYREVLERLAKLNVAKLSYKRQGQQMVNIQEDQIAGFYNANSDWLIQELTSCEFFHEGQLIDGNKFLIELLKLGS